MKWLIPDVPRTPDRANNDIAYIFWDMVDSIPFSFSVFVRSHPGCAAHSGSSQLLFPFQYEAILIESRIGTVFQQQWYGGKVLTSGPRPSQWFRSARRVLFSWFRTRADVAHHLFPNWTDNALARPRHDTSTATTSTVNLFNQRHSTVTATPDSCWTLVCEKRQAS